MINSISFPKFIKSLFLSKFAFISLFSFVSIITIIKFSSFGILNFCFIFIKELSKLLIVVNLLFIVD